MWWILDHRRNNIDIFNKLKNTTSKISVAKKGEDMKSVGLGSIKRNECILTDVPYIPELNKNLLSVHAITEKVEGKVIFDKEKVTIMKDNRKILEKTKKENGFYIVNLNKKTESFLTETKEEKVQLWYRKLGHIRINNMKKY